MTPNALQLPLLPEVPAGWAVPTTVEVRRGVPAGAAGEVVAFRNKRWGTAVSTIASTISEDKPLPEWLVARIARIA